MARKRKPQPEVKAEPRRVTPADIQQKEFRLAFRGYNERDVDVFLDQVTEEVARLHAENKRFRDELEMRSTVRGDTGAAVQADALIRQARDEAARIMAEARAVAARLAVSAATAPAPATPTAPLGSEAAPSPGSRAALGRVVSRERDFLQTLAGLIQDHARALKEDLSSMRSASSAGARRDEAAPRDDAEPRAERKAEGTPAETAADSQPASPEHLTPQPVVRRPLTAEPATPEPATPEPATPEPPVAGGQIMEEPTATDGPAGEGERGDSTQAWESFFDAAAEAPSAEAEETVIHPEEPDPVFDLTAEGDRPVASGGSVAAEGVLKVGEAGVVVDLSADDHSSPPDPVLSPATQARAGGGPDTALSAAQWSGGPDDPDDDAQQDRTVRELFWGED